MPPIGTFLIDSRMASSVSAISRGDFDDLINSFQRQDYDAIGIARQDIAGTTATSPTEIFVLKGSAITRSLPLRMQVPRLKIG